MTHFNGYRIGLESFTNNKGVTIKLGDTVRVKGSKINRVVNQISSSDTTCNIWGIREDNELNVRTAWLDPNKIEIVKAA